MTIAIEQVVSVLLLLAFALWVAKIVTDAREAEADAIEGSR